MKVIVLVLAMVMMVKANIIEDNLKVARF
jgi:hypothetical protein